MGSGRRLEPLIAVLLLALLTLTAWWWSRLEKDRAAREDLETCRARMMSVAEALELYACARDLGFYPDKLKSLVPLFIDQLPRCPTAPDRDYLYQRYDWPSGGANYVLGCPGHHRGVPEGFPKYHLELKEPVTSVEEFMAPLSFLRTAKYPYLPDPTSPELQPDFVPNDRWLLHPDREWFRRNYLRPRTTTPSSQADRQ